MSFDAEREVFLRAQADDDRKLVIDFIVDVTKLEIVAHSDEELMEELRDGVLLCKLMRSLLGDESISPAEKTNLGNIRQSIQNFQKFIVGCKRLNIPDSALFNTVDLLQKKTKPIVRCLLALREKTCQPLHSTPKAATPRRLRTPSGVVSSERRIIFERAKALSPSFVGAQSPLPKPPSTIFSPHRPTVSMPPPDPTPAKKSPMMAPPPPMTPVAPAPPTHTECMDVALSPLPIDTCSTAAQANLSPAAAKKARSFSPKQLDALKERFQGVRSSMKTLTGAIRKSFELTSSDFRSLCDPLVASIGQLECSQQETQARLDVAVKRLHEEESDRRRAFDQLQELRGNIRVFARVRPLLEEEKKDGRIDSVDVLNSCMCSSICRDLTATDTLAVSKYREGATGSTAVSRKKFQFSRVFGQETEQESIFKEVAPLVISAMDGHHVCIFAYGQTGSGKTYTMEGCDSDRGVNYRTLQALFERRDAKSDSEKFKLSVSMVEIYNESIRDLLNTEKGDTVVDARQGPQGVYIPGLTVTPVRTLDDVHAAMAVGSKLRATGATNCNERSSRSHCVLFVNIEGRNKITGAKSHGRLVLVDLAGSERVAKSKATGERLKEAQNINRSLSALGDVVASLTHKNPHVPFRNSKLTYILQNSLGKDNKALMIVQISPTDTSIDESICSLNFAARVQTVELGHAAANKENNEAAKLKLENIKLREVAASKEKESKKLRSRIESLDEHHRTVAEKLRSLEQAQDSKVSHMAKEQLHKENKMKERLAALEIQLQEQNASFETKRKRAVFEAVKNKENEIQREYEQRMQAMELKFREKLRKAREAAGPGIPPSLTVSTSHHGGRRRRRPSTSDAGSEPGSIPPPMPSSTHSEPGRRLSILKHSSLSPSKKRAREEMAEDEAVDGENSERSNSAEPISKRVTFQIAPEQPKPSKRRRRVSVMAPPANHRSSRGGSGRLGLPSRVAVATPKRWKY